MSLRYFTENDAKSKVKRESFKSGLLGKTKEIIFAILTNRLFAETVIHLYCSQFWQMLSTKSLVGSGLNLEKAVSNVCMFLPS